MRIKWFVCGGGVFAIILFSAGVVLAGSEEYDISKETAPPPPQPWCETPATLEIRIGIPRWLAGVSGDTGVNGVVVSPDVSFDQLFMNGPFIQGGVNF